MYDLLTVGNVSMDLYFKSNTLTHTGDRFTLAIGGKYYADYFYEGLGGGAANVAIGVSKMGLQAAVYGKVGKNRFTDIIVKQLNDHHVCKDFCDITTDYSKISTILLSETGERTIINYETPHEHMFATDLDLGKLLEGRAVYISNLPHVSLAERVKMLRFLKKHERFVFENLGTKDCRRPLEQIEQLLLHVDALILNGHEFSELVKKPYEDIDFRKDVRSLFTPLQNKILVVTEGPKGSYSYSASGILHQEAVKPERVVDTTGAGDGYTAGFIAEYLKSKDIGRAMSKGAHYAVKILERVGAN